MEGKKKTNKQRNKNNNIVQTFDFVENVILKTYF